MTAIEKGGVQFRGAAIIPRAILRIVAHVRPVQRRPMSRQMRDVIWEDQPSISHPGRAA